MKQTDLRSFALAIHAENVAAGWWTDLTTMTSKLETRNRPEMLMLIVSELCEGIEGYELGIKDDHLPEYSMEKVEVADAVIRLLDLLGAEYSRGLSASDPFVNPPALGHHNSQLFGRDYPFRALFAIRILSDAMESYRKQRTDRYLTQLELTCLYLLNFYPADEMLQIIEAKRVYNRNRADHKIENRKAEGGKKF